MIKSDQVRVGLIGAGRIGRLHASNLTSRLPMAQLEAIADVDLEAAQTLAEKSDVGFVTEDYRELLERDDIDAVVICSSTDTHAEISQDAARAGLHIFCEKPIDLDLARIDETLEEVERAGVKFQVGFNRRFDPNFKRVREAVAEGRVGTPEILRITSRDPEPPPLDYVRASGGIFLDMTIHDFDMARFLIGGEVDTVYATGKVRVDPAIGEAGDVDTAVITLEFENDVVGTIDNSRRAVYGYDQRVEVFGSDGVVKVGNETPDRHVVLNEDGRHGPNPLYFFLERYTESYVAEMKAFLEAVANDGPVPVTGHDGRMPVVMGLAAGRSLNEGRPVRLDEIG